MQIRVVLQFDVILASVSCAAKACPERSRRRSGRARANGRVLCDTSSALPARCLAKLHHYPKFAKPPWHLFRATDVEVFRSLQWPNVVTEAQEQFHQIVDSKCQV